MIAQGQSTYYHRIFYPFAVLSKKSTQRRFFVWPVFIARTPRQQTPKLNQPKLYCFTKGNSALIKIHGGLYVMQFLA